MPYRPRSKSSSNPKPTASKEARFRPQYKNRSTLSPRDQAEQKMLTISFTISEAVAPALRAAIEEISNEVGGRLSNQFSFPAEQALTDAVNALGKLRAAISQAVPKSNPHYITR